MKISDVKLLVKINATVDELREGIEALMAERDDLKERLAKRDELISGLIVDRDAWKARCLGHTPAAKEER